MDRMIVVYCFGLKPFLPYLKQSCEDVELKHGNVVIAGEIYGGLESHGFHPILKCVHILQLHLKTVPLHDAPVRTKR